MGNRFINSCHTKARRKIRKSRLAAIKESPKGRLKDFFNFYIKRHDRINNWDSVDLGCLQMTGSYLFDKPGTTLYKLAKSKNLWELGSAILSTTYFIRQGQSEDTFAIAEMLVKDKEDLVNKPTGHLLRFAGTKDKKNSGTFREKYRYYTPYIASLFY